MPLPAVAGACSAISPRPKAEIFINPPFPSCLPFVSPLGWHRADIKGHHFTQVSLIQAREECSETRLVIDFYPLLAASALVPCAVLLPYGLGGPIYNGVPRIGGVIRSNELHVSNTLLPSKARGSAKRDGHTPQSNSPVASDLQPAPGPITRLLLHGKIPPSNPNASSLQRPTAFILRELRVIRATTASRASANRLETKYSLE